MNDLIPILEEMLDTAWFQKHVLELYRIERKQTFPAHQKAAQYIYDLLLQEGFSAEYLTFPADGKTAYQDKCMPIGWDVSTMRLTVLTQIPKLRDPVIADYAQEPLTAVKHSVATPPEGLEVKIITESQMKFGANVQGALILLDHGTPPRLDALRMLLDLGAIGWVSDYSEDPNKNPDSVFWANSATENGSWHVLADDRDFIGFQISERNASALRSACEKGTVKAHVLSDGRRYVTEFPAVTALLPGEDPREIWILAHTCEPLINDDSNGVIAAIGILKALRSLAETGVRTLKYSIRVVFASELYGMSAVAEHFGGDLSGKAIGGINLDGFTSSKDKSAYKAYVSRKGADNPGFPGNALLDSVDALFCRNHPEYSITKREHTLGDDTFFNDTSLNMPTVWIHHNPNGYHHNSAQNESMLDTDAAVISFAYAAQWVSAMASLTPEEISAILPSAVEYGCENLRKAMSAPVRPGTDMAARLQFLYNREVSRIRGLSLWGNTAEVEASAIQLPLPEDPGTAPEGDSGTWYDYCEHFTFGRAIRGLPHDLIRIPRELRVQAYGGMLYDPFAEVFSKMDGKKTLRTAICEAEWEKGTVYSEKQLRFWLHRCILFSQYGYLTMTADTPLTKEDLVKTLKALGIKQGDTLLVHSGLAQMGYLQGGADAMLRALRTAVGESGTFLAPAFSLPYLMFDGDVNKGYGYRPYDTRKNGALRDKTVRTGALPKAMLKEPDVFRSGHATHEWVAIGSEAEECVSGHALLDAPTGANSPLKKALDRNGSVVFLGCTPGSNTFLHFVELEANIPYAEPACIAYIDENGNTCPVMIDKQLFGCRNFYGDIHNTFYQEAIRRGLTVHTQAFGLTTLYRMELRELYEITMQMFRDDPYATLCKKPECPFCRRFLPEST